MAKFFSEREIRAIAVFLPLAGLLVLGVVLVRPKADPAAALRAEAEMEERADTLVMRPFDPNTVDYDGLRRLGLSKHEAVSLLKYRAAGKIFRIPEDLTLCYGIDDSLFRRLEPYVRIGRKYAIAPQEFRRGRVVAEPMPPSRFRLDTVSARYLRAIGALSKRQAEAFIRWRDLSGIYDMEELRACYVVSDSVAAALEPYIIFPERQTAPIDEPVEINTADSAALRSVVGIGERTVVSILNYRGRLGGFVCVEQLAEVPGVTERNYEKILKQICCDSCEIRKIDVNFATPKALGRHPYIPPQTLRKLLKKRQLKGGWSTAEELIEDKILTREEAARLAPYLRFGTRSGSDDE
ncbi:helix-hairpin-helix domain-containing protein [uncultured Alistipes sp.]|jgi:competence ComEA-like helix-hairpin-helix protein|uniref:ComEA family DNA-binding protein n=1 Tax=uncultured Alistipes sp. TaxID=538949 RepID=UPI0025F37F44|nr:helix-hairpin-helix domain-containing protein [uncultured Alistipes sp.]